MLALECENMIPKILAPGIACTKFELNLAEADRTERMFKVAIALILPTAVLSRAMDLITTYVGLSMGKSEFNPISAWTLNTFGFKGLVLLNVCVIVLQLILAWIAYGMTLRLKDSTRMIAKVLRLLIGFLVIIFLVVILFLIEICVVASNLQAIFG